MKHIFLSLILLISVVSAFSMPTTWNRRNISMLDGLPTNTVRTIVQDKDGFIWMGTDNGLCRYDGYEVRLYRNYQLGQDQYVSALATLGQDLIVGSSHGAFIFDVETGSFEPMYKSLTATVNSFAVDADGNVWVATAGQGIFSYQPRLKTCSHYPMKNVQGTISSIFADSDNHVWALTRQGKGLYRFNKARRGFDPVTLKGVSIGLDGMTMAQGLDGSILIGTWDRGMVSLHSDGTVEQLLNPVVNGVGTHIHTIYNDSTDIVYIGCEEGLIRYDLQHKTTTVVTGSGNAPASERFVYAVTHDREGGLWMGTFYGGVTYFSPIGERFTSFHADGSILRGSVVSRFCEQGGSKVWVATDDGGLSCYDIHENKFTAYPGESSLKDLNVHGLWAEGNTLWVGTYGKGLLHLDTRTGAIKAYSIEGQTNRASCYAIMRDSRGRLWAASMENANIYDAKNDAFRVAKKFNSLTVDIEEDRKGNVWFATQGSGLWKLAANGKWKNYTHTTDTTSIGSNNINCIREGLGGRLFIATSEGLYEYKPSADSFQKVNVGVKYQNFMGIVINNDEIWLTSAKDLVKYEIGGSTQTYTHSDGLLGGPFQPNACMMASDGRVWLGSVNGINAFYPYQIKANKTEPTVVITCFNIPGNESMEADSLSGILSHAKGVVVEYKENMFSIHFSALSYVAPEKNRYQYKLEGFDDDWIDAGTENKATYTNIPPGTYTFMVRACNNDGVWASQPAKLKITVHPPFYWSLPAKIFYLILAAFLIWFYVHARLLRAERRHQREMKAANEKKEQELREARLRFFTMIAHEIRTPVTLIIGPLENLKEQWKDASGQWKLSEAATQTLDVIDRNAHRLLDLVNQLLDYDKVKRQGMKMNFKLCNIAQIMRSVAVRFEPTLKQNGIKFEVDYPDEGFSAIVDGEAVTKILSNFMTNAGKYTKSHIKMGCVVKGNDEFQLQVYDDGIGISKEDQGKIFDAFFQAKDNKPGTGIGLNTVKLLAEAHHGKAGVESEPGKGSMFYVTMPVKQDVELSEDDDKPLAVKDDGNMESGNQDSGETASATDDNKRPVMLIVEDDDDMRNFIAANFKNDYDVLTAADGKEGLARLKGNRVNIIVSDWMMPNMDGAEFCQMVRKNPDTSHILFIMLTAKTDDESKTEGMNIGADAYIVKPFSMKYLEACIHNLLSRRRLLMEKFANTPTEPISQIADNPVDNKFLTRMNEIIEENVSKPELNVNFIADQMHISRSNLFAKIKSLTDVTPNEMIQVVRLRHAAQLLTTGEHTVSEVAFMVGFNSSSYFTKCFQKQFGVKPSEYKK